MWEAKGETHSQEMNLMRGEVVADTLSNRSAGAEVTQGWREGLEDIHLVVTAAKESSWRGMVRTEH